MLDAQPVGEKILRFFARLSNKVLLEKEYQRIVPPRCLNVLLRQRLLLRQSILISVEFVLAMPAAKLRELTRFCYERETKSHLMQFHFSSFGAPEVLKEESSLISSSRSSTVSLLRRRAAISY